MTKEELERLRGLRAELISLQQQFMRPKCTEVSIFYKDYTSGHPVPKVDVGIDSGEEDERRLARLIGAKTREIHNETIRMEKWIDNVDDPEMRAIIRMYYSLGMTQEEIAKDLKYDRSTIAKKIKSFFW